MLLGGNWELDEELSGLSHLNVQVVFLLLSVVIGRAGLIVSGWGWVGMLDRVIVRYFADGLSMWGYS